MSSPIPEYFIWFSWSSPKYEANASWVSDHQPTDSEKQSVVTKTQGAFNQYKSIAHSRQVISAGDQIELVLDDKKLVGLESKISFRPPQISPERRSPSFLLDLSPILSPTDD